MSELKKIDINYVNFDDLKEALFSMGAFELIGTETDDLYEITVHALRTSKVLLRLPIEELKKFSTRNYHGFHNIKAASLDEHLQDRSKKIKNQIGFHFKLGQPLYALGEVNIDDLYAYFKKSMQILNKLYHIIGEHFIDPSKRSNLINDIQSIMTIRRYFNRRSAEIEKSFIGIPPHTDYGLLTMIVSDVNGLEIKTNKWFKCPFSPQYRYYIIVADWLQFQLGDGFRSGVHRVLEVDQERHSLSVFLNPPAQEKLVSNYTNKEHISHIQNKLNTFLENDY